MFQGGKFQVGTIWLEAHAANKILWLFCELGNDPRHEECLCQFEEICGCFVNWAMTQGMKNVSVSLRRFTRLRLHHGEIHNC